ncbi:cupin domain-containing protein [Actinokineospora enzanensis]|uniref:cupin domain-containing protein n=1 Tax=Actinokineospora enzanensis TaxID=155975 RepID=UPI000525163B|nr:cupin domain-containing protein [Actinokineospora enzanensis]
MTDPRALATALDLRPLPTEGGLWSRSYADDTFSAIYYLLESPAFSAWHRLDRPELYVHHAGAPLTTHLIGPSGYRSVTLGSDVAAGERPQLLVPAGTWQASETPSWSLVGTVVVPPYTDDSVEFATASLVADRPELARLLPP